MNPLYEKVSKNPKITFIKDFIKKIIVEKKKVLVNKKKFDEIYVTTYSGVEKIELENSQINIKPRLIISEHVMIIAKNINRKYLAYSKILQKF